MIAAAGVVSISAVSSAQPAPHTVRYTITTQVEANFNLYYMAVEPPNQAALDADSSAFFRNDSQVHIVPGTPWVFETTMTDTQWAYINAGSAHRVAPNPHCELAIDGQVVVQADWLSGALCATRPW